MKKRDAIINIRVTKEFKAAVVAAAAAKGVTITRLMESGVMALIGGITEIADEFDGGRVAHEQR